MTQIIISALIILCGIIGLMVCIVLKEYFKCIESKKILVFRISEYEKSPEYVEYITRRNKERSELKKKMEEALKL